MTSIYSSMFLAVSIKKQVTTTSQASIIEKCEFVL
jgi:hypothetical protein